MTTRGRGAWRVIEPFITRLNEIRRLHPALHQLRNITFHHVENDALLAYSKFDPVTGDAVLVVVNLNPFGPEDGTLWVDLPALGLDWHETFGYVMSSPVSNTAGVKPTTCGSIHPRP